MKFDPIGWSTWGEAGLLGFLILLAFFSLWIVFDAFRILRVRRMLISVDRYDVDKLKKIADVGIKTRRFFRRFSKKETEDGDETTAIDAASRVGKRSAKMWGLRALKMRKLSPAGLLTSVAVGAAIERYLTLLMKKCKRNLIKLQKRVQNLSSFFSSEISVWRFHL